MIIWARDRGKQAEKFYFDWKINEQVIVRLNKKMYYVAHKRFQVKLKYN